MDTKDTRRVHDTWTFLEHRLSKSNPMLGEVLSYWDSLRQGDTLPARIDLDPRVIQSALGHSFILDRARPGAVRMRVAGSHMNDLMGMEVRGMPIRAFFDLLERRKLMDLIETVFTAPALLEMDVEAAPERGPGLKGRMLVLPMRDHAGIVSKALGCLVTTGTYQTPPHRFKITRDQVTPVSQSLQRTAEIITKVPGFAESVSHFAPRQELVDTAPGPVPWLRIVQT